MTTINNNHSQKIVLSEVHPDQHLFLALRPAERPFIIKLIVSTILQRWNFNIFTIPSSVQRYLRDVRNQVTELDMRDADLTDTILRSISNYFPNLRCIQCGSSTLNGNPITQPANVFAFFPHNAFVVDMGPSERANFFVNLEINDVRRMLQGQENNINPWRVRNFNIGTAFDFFLDELNRARSIITAIAEQKTEQKSAPTVEEITNSLNTLAIKTIKTAEKKAEKNERTPPRPMQRIEIIQSNLFKILQFLRPIFETLHFGQNISRSCDLLNTLAISRRFIPYRISFANQLLRLSPLATLIPPPRLFPVNVPSNNPSDRQRITALIAEICSLANPENVTSLDLRRYQINGNYSSYTEQQQRAFLYGWAEAICARYPNLQQLYMPCGAILDRQMGRILRRLRNLHSLDIMFVRKDNIQGLLELNQVQHLYCVPVAYFTSAWSPDPRNRRVDLPHQISLNPRLLNISALTTTGLSIICQMRWLKTLSLALNAIIPQSVSLSLQHCTQLEQLYVTAHSHTDSLIQQLVALPNLTTLALDGTQFTDQVLHNLHTRYPLLKNLHLVSHNFTDELFTHLTQCQNIEELFLNGRYTITQAGWCRLQEIRSLKKIAIQQAITFGDRALEAISSLPPLKVLMLENCVGFTLSTLMTFNVRHHECATTFTMRGLRHRILTTPAETPHLERIFSAAPEAEKRILPFLIPTWNSIHFNQSVMNTPLAHIPLAFTCKRLYARVCEHLRVADCMHPRAIAGGNLVSLYPIYQKSIVHSITTLDLRNMVVSPNFTTQLRALIERYVNVRTLRLPGCRLTADLGHDLATLQHLRSLDISLCPKDTIAALQHLPQVTELNNKFPHESNDLSLSSQQQNERMEYVNREIAVLLRELQNPALEFTAAQLISLPGLMPQLKRLSLGPTSRIMANDMERIMTAFQRLGQLEMLHCQSAPLTLQIVQRLAPLANTLCVFSHCFWVLQSEAIRTWIANNLPLCTGRTEVLCVEEPRAFSYMRTLMQMAPS